mmetsp:Transcript_10495/g.27477  ORF Transcript_10495/g.27477 Transcript_10495/m.27477 type:complete len:217 (-) Transcript_10495:963-1613(-)
MEIGEGIATVFGFVQTHLLVFLLHSKCLCCPDCDEQHKAGCPTPCCDANDAQHLYSQESAVAPVENAYSGSASFINGAIEVCGASFHTIRITDKHGVGKEAHQQHTKSADKQVDGCSIERVINLQLEEEVVGANIRSSGQNSNDGSGPQVNNTASCCDTNEASESAIDEPIQSTKPAFRKGEHKQKAGESSEGSCESGGHRSALSHKLCTSSEGQS